MRFFFVSLVLTLSLGAQSREVDNYMAWGVDLEDSGPAIDEYMRAKMREAIEIDKVAERELPPEDADNYEEVFEWYASCYGTVERLLKEAYYSPTYQKIEEYIDDGNGLDIYPRRPDMKDDDERARLGQTPDAGYMTNRE